MFTPGQSGNPAGGKTGRPRNTHFTLPELVEKRLGNRGKAAIADRLVDLAKDGNETALNCVVSLLQEKKGEGREYGL